MGRCRTFVLSTQSGLIVANTVPAANYLVNPYPATFANLDDARKAIRTEQRLEMAMEGFVTLTWSAGALLRLLLLLI